MICGKLSSGWGEIFIKRNTFSSSIFFSDLLLCLYVYTHSYNAIGHKHRSSNDVSVLLLIYITR